MLQNEIKLEAMLPAHGFCQIKQKIWDGEKI
jgi:hypothetical protein